MSFDRRKPPDVESLVSVKIDNLSYRTTADQLKRAFEKFGEIGDVYIPRDPYGHEASRGFGFVRFYDSRDADDAVHAMDGISLNGREIRVQLARHNRSHRGDFAAPSRGRRNYSRRSRSRSRSHSRQRRRRSRSSSRDRYRRRSKSRSRDQKARSRSRNSRKRDLSRSKSRSAKRHRTEENGSGKKQDDFAGVGSEQALVLTDVEANVSDVDCMKSDLEGNVGCDLVHPSALNDENSAQEDGDDNNNYQLNECIPGDGAVNDQAMQEVELNEERDDSENNPGDVNNDVEHDDDETDEEFKPEDTEELKSAEHVQNCENENIGSGGCEDDDDDNDTIENTSENDGCGGDRYSGNADEDSCSRDIGNENSCDRKDSEDGNNDRADNDVDECDDN